MKSFYNFRSYVTVIVTTICISISTEIKLNLEENQLPIFLIGIVISLLISLVLSDLISQFLFRLKWFRRIILGRRSIEGFWILEPLTCAENINIFCGYAMAEMYFDSSSFSLRTTVYRINKKQEVLQSSSNNVTFLEDTCEYLNFFYYREEGISKNALALGKFISSPGEKYLDIYQGDIITFDGNKPISQQGKYITSKEVREAKKLYDNDCDWQKAFINEFKKSKESTEL